MSDSMASTATDPRPGNPGSDDPGRVEDNTIEPTVNNILDFDPLGTFIAEHTELFKSCPSWEDFVRLVHGPSSLQDNLSKLPHAAGEFLESLHVHGVPCVLSDAPWDSSTLDARVALGCHRSARDHAAFIRKEMAEFVSEGFYTVLPYSLIRDLPGLRLSPLGVKEERDRRPRLVVDHTWYGVNGHTIEYTPKEAMQFGGALHRILHYIHHSDPRYGPVYLAKYDIKDGFYRMMLRPDHAPSLAVILPTYPGEEPMIAIPLVLTMGWINSPPSFCAMSETVCDMTAARSYRRHAPPHRLEHHAAEHDDISQ